MGTGAITKQSVASILDKFSDTLNTNMAFEESKRRYDADHALRVKADAREEATHALQNTAAQLSIDKGKDEALNRETDHVIGQIAASDGSPLTITSIVAKASDGVRQRLASNPFLQNADERAAAYEQLGSIAPQWMKDPANPELAQQGLAAINNVVRADQRITQWDTPQGQAEVAKVVPANGGFQIFIKRFDPEQNQWIEAPLTDDRKPVSAGGDPTVYTPDSLMRGMIPKINVMRGVSLMKMANGDPAELEKQRKIAEAAPVLDELAKSAKGSPYADLVDFYTHTAMLTGDVSKASELFKSVVDAKADAETNAVVNTLLNSGARELAFKGDIKGINTLIKGLKEKPDAKFSKAAVDKAEDVLLKWAKTGAEFITAKAHEKTASKPTAPAETGTLDDKAIESVGKLLTAATQLESGKVTTVDDITGVPTTRTVTPDPEGAKELRRQAAAKAAQYMGTGKISKGAVTSIYNSFPEDLQSVIMSTLKGKKSAPPAKPTAAIKQRSVVPGMSSPLDSALFTYNN